MYAQIVKGNALVQSVRESKKQVPYPFMDFTRIRIFNTHEKHYYGTSLDGTRWLCRRRAR